MTRFLADRETRTGWRLSHSLLVLFLFFKTQSTGFSFAAIYPRLQWRKGGADWNCQKRGRVGKHRCGKEVTRRPAFSHTPQPPTKMTFLPKKHWPLPEATDQKRKISHPKGYSLPNPDKPCLPHPASLPLQKR